MVARATVVVEVGEDVCGERSFVKLFRASLCDASERHSELRQLHRVACLVFFSGFFEDDVPDDDSVQCT